jgi:hypothetical protein
LHQVELFDPQALAAGVYRLLHKLEVCGLVHRAAEAAELGQHLGRGTKARILG